MRRQEVSSVDPCQSNAVRSRVSTIGARHLFGTPALPKPAKQGATSGILKGGHALVLVDRVVGFDAQNLPCPAASPRSSEQRNAHWACSGYSGANWWTPLSPLLHHLDF